MADEDEISILDTFECSDCGEGVTLIHLKGKYMTVESVAVPAVLGVGGYSLGSSVGIAALGGAIAGSWPLAIAAALFGGSATYVMGDTKDSLQCPHCDTDVDL